MGKIDALYAVIDNVEYELSSVKVDFSLDMPTCHLLPVEGISTINRISVPGYSLKKGTVDIGQKVKVYMGWDDEKLLIFYGRVSSIAPTNVRGVGTDANSLATVIVLRHIMADFTAIGIGAVFFNDGKPSDKLHKFTAQVDRGTFMHEQPFETHALIKERKVPAHIKEIVRALADWYQYREDGAAAQLQVESILKASGCAYREVIGEGNKTNNASPLSIMIKNATAEAVGSILASKGTFMDILKGLADYTYLTMIPRLEDVILVPNLSVYQPPDNNWKMGQTYLLGVQRNKQALPFTVDRVGVDVQPLVPWYSKSRNLAVNQTVLDKGVSYEAAIYPPVKENQVFTNVFITTPSPLLRGRLISPIVYNGEDVAIPEDPHTVTSGEEDPHSKEVAQSGETAYSPSDREGIKLSERAAKASYGTYAYSDTSVTIRVVFDALVKSRSKGLWSDGSIYSILGQVVQADLMETDGDNPLSVGRVNRILLFVDIGAGQLTCSIDMDHVRSGSVDKQHSLSISEHPIYENIESAGLE